MSGALIMGEGLEIPRDQISRGGNRWWAGSLG